MEEDTNIFESLLGNVESYSKDRIELFKLKTVDKISDVVATTTSRIVGLIFFLFFFIMGSIGLAHWLGEVLGKLWYGFFIVAALYGLIGIVMYFFRQNWLKKIVANSLIKQILN